MKGKLIIIEGPDECGKTTLSMTLARALGGFVFHSTASPLLFSALPDYHRNIMDNIEKNVGELGKIVILDRFWPSEMAYGQLLRPDSGYSEVSYELCSRIHRLDHIYIFCDSPYAWNRYVRGHIDPAHSLTITQFNVIRDNYHVLQMNLKSQNSGTCNYCIEVEGKDDRNMMLFVRFIRNCLELPHPQYELSNPGMAQATQ